MNDVHIGCYHYLVADCDQCGRERVVRYMQELGWTCIACLFSQPWTRHLSDDQRERIQAAYVTAWEQLVERAPDPDPQPVERLVAQAIPPGHPLRHWLGGA